MAAYRPPRLTQPLVEPYLSAACDAWETGGSLLLGLWAARRLEHWTVRSYGALVDQVRATLGDATDYSREEAADA
jgi:hypothetical protein